MVRRSHAVSLYGDDDLSLLLVLYPHGIFIQQPPDQGVRRPGALRQATRPAFLAIDFSDHGAREEKDNQVEGPEIAPSQLLQRLALHEHVGVGEYVERFPHIAHGTGQAVKNIDTSYQASTQHRSSAARAPPTVPPVATGNRSGSHV